MKLAVIERAGVAALVVAATFLFAGASYAAPPTPIWQVQQESYPTHISPGGSGSYQVSVRNIGMGVSAGPVTVTMDLPAGVTASSGGDGYYWDCPGAAGATTVVCTLVEANLPSVGAHAAAPVLPIFVDAAADVSGAGESVATVEGGGATSAAVSRWNATFSSAPATFGIERFEGGALERNGRMAKQAGGHPDVTTSIAFNTVPTAFGGPGPVGNVKDIAVDLPPGLVGNPTAVPACDPALVASNQGAACPAETQVGVVETALSYGYPQISSNVSPVYNVKPPAGSPARLSFNVAGVVVNIDPTVRTGGDYGLTAKVANISQTLPAASTRLTLWGVPADPVHDAERNFPNGATGAPSTETPRAFMTAPTACSRQPLITKMTAVSWQDLLDVKSSAFGTDFNGDVLETDGCDRLSFDPGFVLRTDSPPKRGAPAGVGIDLTVPQNDNPDGLASSTLKKAVVTLPEGMVVNPSSAQGLEACSPAQIDINGPAPAACPSGSKIGSIDIQTPLLEEPLSGSVYLAAQRQNPFGTTLALYLVATGSGVTIKLPGRVDPDPVTGRVIATFDNNPQLPFSKLSLHLKTGPRAPLSLPTACGPATTTAVLTPWSATPPVTITTSFDVSYDGNGAPCPPQAFAPTLAAGSINPVTGADSTFTLGLSRTDDDQELRDITVNMPKGLLGRIANTTLCEAAQANAGTCGDASKIGEVTTAAGAGSNPIALAGRVYITGPYKGGPFGLSIVVPAVAGPFDLGTVVVRAAISVDPITAQLSIVSDPLPRILEGIPLQVRLVDVSVDRPGFMFNPTSCAASQVVAQVGSAAGASTTLANRFQVGSCGDLALKPSLGLSLSGKGQTTDGKHPAVTAALIQKPGQANLKKVRVALPLSLALDPDNANGLCEFVDGSKAEPTCPKASIVGTATATTPILDQPLTGPVYFVKNVRKDAKSGRDIRTLPKLVIPLIGQNGVKLTLTGTSNVENDQLVTTFDNIPDAPVSSFKLSIIGGKGGILTVSGADICKATQIAHQQIDGQNNKNADTDIYIQTPACSTKIITKTITKTTVKLKIGGLGAGKVTVTGRGIKKTSKTIVKSTVATITAKRVGGERPGAFKVKFTKAKAAAGTATR